MVKRNNPKFKKLTGLVIGCGSIGERHLSNLKKMGLKSVYVFDKDKARTKQIETKYNVKGFFDLTKAGGLRNRLFVGCFSQVSALSLPCP